MNMKNEKVRLGAEKIIEKLTQVYGNVDIFVFYNNEFEQYEMVISSKYEENAEFESFFDELLDSEIINKNLYLYAYFVDDFEEMKKNYDKKTYKEKDDKTKILESILPKIKLLFNETGQDTDYLILIPLDENNNIKLMKVHEK